MGFQALQIHKIQAQCADLLFPHCCSSLNGNTQLIVRWRKEQEYYIVRLYQDLIGDWIVTQCWGDSTCNDSTVTHTVARSYQAGRNLLKEINREQKQRGFRPAKRDEIQLGFDFT